MTRISSFCYAAAAFIAVAGCQRDDTAVSDKLDQIDKRLQSIEASMARGGGAARPAAAAQRPQRPTPKPADTYSVPVAGSPSIGASKAKVTIVEAFEFACPYCERVGPTMEQLLNDYGDDLRVVYKHFVVHPQHATTPALASCAADRQGKFKEMEALIWEKGFKAGRDLSKENMIKLAGQVGLDMDRFNKDLDGQDCAAKIRQDQGELTRVGTSGTPAFYINGRFLSGARPIDQFKTLIDEELKKANDRISRGEATPAGYYDEFVVKRGKKKLDPVAAERAPGKR